jgi:hypothetical protein
MDFYFTLLLEIEMASELGCESSPPPTKRPKIAAFKAENGPNLCQTQLELCLENSNQSRNQSGKFFIHFLTSRQIFWPKTAKIQDGCDPLVQSANRPIYGQGWPILCRSGSNKYFVNKNKLNHFGKGMLCQKIRQMKCLFS